ncbi:hypothetical protein [Actinokineospora xionganensis]|uniref:Uncharacterized protein n=1 Tax=Actinokineospora xionganensis TaxID=2684470 RepID=A0ABR7L0I0_9PSEU|nr:hypothetical protein [Actinokineospora xionganensis]MBC6446160.1 hypothetical protein [Actinokineospora xionganensis]
MATWYPVGAHTVLDAIDTNADSVIFAAVYRVLVEACNGLPTDTDDIFPSSTSIRTAPSPATSSPPTGSSFRAGGAPGTWVFGRFSPN